MRDLFKLESETDALAVVKVNKLTLRDIALHPFLNGNMAYISVTRGEQHTFTVVHKDGTTWSWESGNRRSTVVSDNIHRLQQAVENFLIDNGVLLENTTKKLPETFSIFYNDTFKAWCARIGNQMIRNNKVSDECAMLEYIKDILGISKQLKTRYVMSATGIWVCTVYL